MTRLTKPVRRVVDINLTGFTDSPVAVTLTKEGVLFREKGRRTSYLMPYRSAYFGAVRLKVDAERREKAAAKKARRAAR